MRLERRLGVAVVVLGALGLGGGCGEPVDPGRHVVAPSLAARLAAASASDTSFVVVRYDEAATTGAAVAARIKDLGAGARALIQLPFVGALATKEQVSAIAAIPGVLRVTENRQLRWLSLGRSATAALLDESVPTIKADQARVRYGVSGRGIGVAILDSGIDGFYQHDVAYPTRTVQNLKVIANGRDLVCFKDAPCPGSIYIENLANSETSVGHGTHVSGIAGGNGTMSNGLYTGVAPGANLIGIGTGDVLFVFWALAGFDYILQNQDRYNIKVVNNSWGSSGPFDPDDPVSVASKRAHDRGITVVFAAGNDGPDQNTLNPYSVAPWVIGVAASCSVTDSLGRANQCGGGRMLADFSSRGIPGDALYHPTVTAPGVYVNSTRASSGAVLTGLDAPKDMQGTCGLRQEYIAYYTCASGTSMATPHVTGVVALMQERAGGRLTPDQVRSILVQSADPLAGYATFEVGAGLVNALAAVGRSR
ncbi:MAG TPA: S8 family serine peptidase [Gemmatimonadales bacterium]|jgi:serine protease AprX|nr:S8 family serine peptidase [Gemmatimonadales bacterium]